MKTRVKFTLATLALAITAGSANAQVSNGDFSTATKAPRTFNQINLANGWNNANGGTADFYHKNASKCSNMGTSDNRLGQQAAFNGDGYAGIITYQNDKTSGFSLKDMAVVENEGYGKYSEYITTKLDASLSAGKSYTFTYYVSLAENSGYAVSGFGAHFSKDAMNQKSNAYIMAKPQVVTSNVVDSKSNWTKITGTFTATGGEQYVTIGVFNAPASSKAVGGGNGVNSIRAYYFVDGVSIAAGVAEKDSDGDGIVDSMDKCPTVKGTVNGCPDTDGDGVADMDDDCPTVAGTEKGCPKIDNSGVDTDKDGLADVMETKLGTDPKNPDSDGDGLNDGEEILGLDQASTTAIASKKSDPKNPCDPIKTGDDCDADGDGLTNAEEAKLGTNPNNPDSDGDTVKDNVDKCPLIPGTLSAGGCALDTDLLAEIKRASENIYFNSGKSTIKSESYPDLDKLASILIAHPEVKASIEGHTDSQGNDQMNLNLSKSRAKAVKDYLVKKGVQADHLSSEGFGETKPVADNGTAEGRAKNRRVIVQTSMFKVK